MRARFGCIVEGHGEGKAIGILLRRIAQRIDPAIAISPEVLRIPRDRLMRHDGLERAVELIARRVGGGSAILILLDADDGCPAEIAPRLMQRAKQTRQDIHGVVVMAKREYESWFIAAAESLAGQRGLRRDIRSPAEPEAIRGAKEWLRQHMEEGRKYSETLDQPALTAQFDLDMARRRADSFDKCYREIVRLLNILRGAED